MANNPIPSTTTWVDAAGMLLKGLPWAKITAPMVPTIFALWYIGSWLMELHLANINNSITNGFPTTGAFWTYLISAIFMITVYLGLSIWHLKANINKVQ
jgi:hypothetical protein